MGLAAAALAAAPTALSSRPGTRLLLKIIKRFFLSPTSEVEVESLSLSWRRPPVIKGLKLIDRGQEPATEGGSERKRGGAVVSSSSALFSSSASPSSSSPPSSPASLPEAETSGSIVAAAEAVSASRSLAAIALTKRSFEVVVTRPFLDLFPTADGRTSRVARALRGGDDDGGSDSDDDDEKGPLFVLGDPASSESEQRQQQQQELPFLGPAAGLRFSAEARGSLGGGGRRGRRRGGSGTAFSLVVAEGRARVPLDLREALGESVHAVALLGEEALLAEGAEMLTYRGKSREGGGSGGDENDDDDGDDNILTGVSPSSPLSVPYDATWASRWRSNSASGRLKGGRAAVPAAFEVRSEKAAVAADGWLLLASTSGGAGERKRRPRKKGSERGASAKTPVFVLRKPAAARAALTPPLVKHCLSRLSPLLADAVAVGGGGSAESGGRDGSALPALAATLSPANAVLFPRLSRGVLRVEPLLVELKKGKGGTGMASKALGWLDRAAAAASVVSAASGGDGGDGGGLLRRFPFGGGSSSSSALSSALNSSPSLVAWTSPAEIDLRISKRGGVTVGVRRIDVLVGPPLKVKKSDLSSSVFIPDASRSARFATWGTVDAEGGRLALTLGIPAETLKRAAGSGGASSPPSPSSSSPSSPSFPSSSGRLSGVPEDSMLCVDIRGSLDAPRVDFAGATARLAELVALSSAAKASPSSSSSSSTSLLEKELSSSSASSFASPALAAVKKMFWKKAAEKARGGGAAEPASAPGSGGSSVPRRSCRSLPWEEEEGETGANGATSGRKGRRRERLGQIEAVLLRQERQRRGQRPREAVFDER